MKRVLIFFMSLVLWTGVVAKTSGETTEIAPGFEAQTTTGKTVKLAQFRGQVVLLDFWASWCKPCQEEFPFLIELQHANKGKNFTVLAINLDEDTTKMQAFLDKLRTPIPFPVITDPQGKIPGLYKVDHMPMTILIAPNGEIRYKQGGFKSSSQDKLAQAVKALLAEPAP